MIIKGIDIPERIIESIENNNLVIFAGAGVSMNAPTDLPGFMGLAKEISKDHVSTIGDENTDQFLGKLECGGVNVKKRACEIIKDKKTKPNSMHKGIVNLFEDISNLKIITTNYDTMFEKTLEEKVEKVKIYSNPAIPFGDDFNGIIHLHGDSNDYKNIIITDSDFGKAYLTKRHISKFLVDLFNSDYTVLFVGFSYKDITMRYLTRGIPAFSDKKYIFTDDNQADWDLYNIIPIFYNNNDYKQLNKCINTLGEYANRGFLDWQTKLTLYSEKSPLGLTLEETDEIIRVFNNKELTISFLKKINSKEWLFWLEEKGILNNLFNKESNYFTKIDFELCTWIIKNFTSENFEDFCGLLEKKGFILNKIFQYNIAKRITEKEKTSKEIFAKILVLLDISSLNQYIKSKLFEVSIDYNLEIYSIKILLSILEYSINITEEAYLTSKGSKRKINLSFSSYLCVIEKNWKILVKNIDSGYKKVFSYIINMLEEIMQVSIIWDEPFDFANYTDFINGPKDPNTFEYCIVILKDILKLMRKRDNGFLEKWIKENINSEIVILRRLAIYELAESCSFLKEEKIVFLMKKISLFSIHEKQEIFILVSKYFDQISKKLQKKIMDYIMQTKPDIFINISEKQCMYERFNWLKWIDSKCKDNSMVKNNLRLIKEKYPTFQKREFPELNFVFTETKNEVYKKPISKKELFDIDKLEKNYKFLISYKDKDFRDLPRENLLNMLSEILNQNFSYVKELIKLMLKNNDYKSDIWERVIGSLEKHNLKIDEIANLINTINKEEELLKNQSRSLSFYILKLCKLRKENMHNRNFINELFNFSWLLYKYRDECEIENINWANKALNCTQGNIAQIWMYLLQYENRITNKKEIPKKYKTIFESILRNKNDGEARCVLVGYYSYLIHLDKVWGREKLLPYFNTSNEEKFLQAWEGFLIFSKLNIEVGEELKDKYLAALEKIELFHEDIRKFFIRSFLYLLIYVIDNPADEYIPKLFKEGNKKDKKIFHENITSVLVNHEPQENDKLWERWLGKYCKNRIDGIPESLLDSEIEDIMEWTILLRDAFPEVVKEIIELSHIDMSKAFFHVDLKNVIFLRNIQMISVNC